MLNKYQLRNVWRRVVPGMEPVTLRSRQPAGSVAEYVAYRLPRAKGKPIDAAEATAGGVVVTGLRKRQWQIWREALDGAGAPDPKIGDLVLQEDGAVWLVQGVSPNNFLGEVFNVDSQERP